MSSNSCDCCQGISAQTPATLDNRPGLSAIAYRVGTWAQFKASMLDALSITPELTGLHTRSDDDFAIALLDAWAIASDILTFYQERIANESYLRTAAERLSLGELAKLIGYKLSPGVAASTALAFIMDQPLALPKLPPTVQVPAVQINAAPTTIALALGIKVQSVPGPGQQPATFETIAPIEARAAWNAILPRRSVALDGGPENASANVRLQGILTNLQIGDSILLISASGQRIIQRIFSVIPDNDTQTTTLQFEGNASPAPAALPTAAGVIAVSQTWLNDALIWSSIKGSLWQDQNDLVEIASKQGWSLDSLENGINAIRGVAAPGSSPPLQAFALKTRAALFGNNAPAYDSISPSLRYATGIETFDSGGHFTGFAQVSPAYPNTWEGATLIDDATFLNNPGAIFDLDNTYPGLVVGDYVGLVSSDGSPATVVAQISSAVQATRSDYLLTGKVTRITLDIHWESIQNFAIRGTLVLGQTDELTVTEFPLTAAVDNTAPLMLDGAYLSLKAGQLVAITGERTDKTGETMSEVTSIKSLALVDGYTQLTFDPELNGSYVRSSVKINANVAPATHGESKSEILGSGDGTQAFQRFKLNQPPLTYVSAATATGSLSTLTVRVNGVQWSEVPFLYGHSPAERIYTIGVDQAGTTWVQFGDGTTGGARLPTGTNNVIGSYRQGIGLVGNAAAGQLSMLLSRPLGLKDVSNPLASSGAGDPEAIENARANAPVTVRTLGRIVSLEDFEDFARASAGIAKARVTWMWNGTRDVPCVTVSGVDGASVAPGTPQYKNLLAAMQGASDGTITVALCDYVPVHFALAATITPDPSLDGPTVLAAVRAALRQAFSFAARDFMQPVYRSEVITVMQQVSGVVALTLDGFVYSGKPLTDPQQEALVAQPPTLGPGGAIVGAELLTLQNGPLNNVVLAA